MAESRTIKSMKNGKVALFYSLAGVVATFFFRKIFIAKLGAELLGLNTTAMNLLQFLNLAELGIGSAVAFSLYKPLFNKDYGTINEIVSVQGWLYRRVGYVILIASAILMCFFPFIFDKTDLSLWYAYATFGVLLLNALLGYYFNYNQIVLTANQENYKILYVTRSTLILKLSLQCVAIYYLDNGYIWWLVIEALAAVSMSVLLHILVKRSLPNLDVDVNSAKAIKHKYAVIITKTKQLFVHKIADFVLTQTQSLIIFAFTSLTIVAYYGNYLLIISGLSLLILSAFNSMSASVGNLVSEGDKTRILAIFEELYSIRFMIVSSLTITAYFLTPYFIELWLGKQYVLSETTLILMLATFFIAGIRATVGDYLQSYGLFQDIWSPIIEATLNIGLSILLGFYLGLNGILLGAIISLVIIVLGWKPYFLFKSGIKESFWFYARIFFIHIFTMLFFIVVLKVCDISYFENLTPNKYFTFILNGLIFLIGTVLVMTILLSIDSKGMRKFISRIVSLRTNK